MKQILFYLAIFFILNITTAQVVFCPPGAKWNNNFLTGIGHVILNAGIAHTGDSIDGTDTCKILSTPYFYKQSGCRSVSPLLIRQRGDTIFMKNNHTQHSWQILYNFAATAGDSWHTSFLNAQNPPAPVTYTITVDSVGSIVYNGFNLKRLYVKYKGGSQYGTTTESAVITERIGVEGFMFNYNTSYCSSDPSEHLALLCYSDNSFGLKQFSEKPCDYSSVIGSGIYENALSGINIRMFPNPVKDRLQVEWENAARLEIRFGDIAGREVKWLQLEHSATVELNDLSNGLYLLTITRDGKPLHTTKLIKAD